jgi:hypothetical protein
MTITDKRPDPKPCNECGAPDGAVEHRPSCDSNLPMKCDFCNQDFPEFKFLYRLNLSNPNYPGLVRACSGCQRLRAHLRIDDHPRPAKR